MNFNKSNFEPECLSEISISLLKTLRQKNSWSQLETSYRADISPRTLQRIELRQTSISQIQYFKLLKTLSIHHFIELDLFYRNSYNKLIELQRK